jgi:hypothetical protein
MLEGNILKLLTGNKIHKDDLQMSQKEGEDYQLYMKLKVTQKCFENITS